MAETRLYELIFRANPQEAAKAEKTINQLIRRSDTLEQAVLKIGNSSNESIRKLVRGFDQTKTPVKEFIKQLKQVDASGIDKVNVEMLRMKLSTEQTSNTVDSLQARIREVGPPTEAILGFEKLGQEAEEASKKATQAKKASSGDQFTSLGFSAFLVGGATRQIAARAGATQLASSVDIGAQVVTLIDELPKLGDAAAEVLPKIRKLATSFTGLAVGGLAILAVGVALLAKNSQDAKKSVKETNDRLKTFFELAVTGTEDMIKAKIEELEIQQKILEFEREASEEQLQKEIERSSGRGGLIGGSFDIKKAIEDSVIGDVGDALGLLRGKQQGYKDDIKELTKEIDDGSLVIEKLTGLLNDANVQYRTQLELQKEAAALRGERALEFIEQNTQFQRLYGEFGGDLEQREAAAQGLVEAFNELGSAIDGSRLELANVQQEINNYERSLESLNEVDQAYLETLYERKAQLEISIEQNEKLADAWNDTNAEMQGFLSGLEGIRNVITGLQDAADLDETSEALKKSSEARTKILSEIDRYNNDVEERERKLRTRIARLREDFEQKSQDEIAKERKKAQDKLADIDEKSQDKRAKLLRDFQRKLRDIDRDFAEAQITAVEDRDVLALFRARRQQQKEKEKARDAYNDKLKDLDKSLEREREKIQENLDARIEAIEEANDLEKRRLELRIQRLNEDFNNEIRLLSEKSNAKIAILQEERNRELAIVRQNAIDVTNEVVGLFTRVRDAALRTGAFSSLLGGGQSSPTTGFATISPQPVQQQQPSLLSNIINPIRSGFASSVYNNISITGATSSDFVRDMVDNLDIFGA